MKVFNLLVLAFGLMILSPHLASSQIEYAAVANFTPQSIETKSLVILFTSDASNRSILSPKKDERTSLEDDLVAAELYDRSAVAEFGSYVNPYSNQLRIVTNDQVEYSKIQITDKSTGKVVLKENLDQGKNFIDFTTMKPGTYIIIMSDSGANIFSEEISIF